MAACLAAVGRIVPASALPSRPRADLRIALLLTGPAEGALARGVRLGEEEARHTASLLGRGLEFERVTESALAGAAAALRAFDAILVDGDDALVTRVAMAAAGGRPLVFNLSAAGDELRRTLCAPHVFHVAASDRMRRDAVAEWRAVANGDSSEVDAIEWHPGLRRFGAEQLNDRYDARFGDGMRPAAWRGWLGVKLAVESGLRGGAQAGAWLRSPRARFDGHKGRALSFRPWDGQLRQPLYIVRGDAVLAEVPTGGEASLDRIGAGAKEVECAA